MREDCIKAVSTLRGKQLTAKETKGIEERILRNKKALAIEDRAKYLSMSEDQRLTEAAQRAANELITEAAKERQRVGLTIQKHDLLDNYMKSQKEKYGFDTLESLDRVLDFKSDGKNHIQSVSTRAEAIRDDYMRRLVQTFESANPRIFGLFSDVEGMRALTYELFGQDSSKMLTLKGKPISADRVKAAKEAAKAWSQVTEEMRQSYNNAGGKIRRLTNWRMPQNHSQYRVSIAGRKDWLQSLSPAERAIAKLKDNDPPVEWAQNRWVKDILPSLDRSKYVNEDGSYMSDSEMVEMLKDVWVTIATGGANKVEPGRYKGSGALANRHAEERSLHFKDAESYLSYQKSYGATDGYTTMVQHVASLSHDIAMLDTFGPNPDLQFKFWLDKGASESASNKPSKSGKADKRVEKLRNLFDFLSGHTRPVVGRRLAQNAEMARNWIMATKLGSAFLSSFSDKATLWLTANHVGVSQLQLQRNLLLNMNPLNKQHLRQARLAGLSLQTFMGEINRWGFENLGGTFSSKMSGLTMRLSGLNAISEARRRAFGVSMFGSIGKAVDGAPTFSRLDALDKKILESKGVTETDFKVWREAELEDWGNGNATMLTPEAIYSIPDEKLVSLGDPKILRRDAALKLLGAVKEEMNMAVIEPGARQRAAMKMTTQPGTWTGEIARSFFLLKSFPFAMIAKHMGRGFGAPTMGGKAAYVAGLMALTTLMGAASIQMNNFASGRDPDDMTKSSFWAAALLKGGSLGIYGDFLLSTNTSYGNTMLATLSGPAASAAEDFIGLTQGNLVELLQGKETHAGAEAVKFFKSNMPLQNLWYTKAATDRIFFNNWQEMASPGFNRRVEMRQKREFDRTYYWSPGSMTPERAPNLGKIVGED